MLVEIGMRGEKPALLGRGQAGHAVDIVVAVAFDMSDADQIDQRQILLQREARLNGQVFAGHEIAGRTAPRHSTARIARH